MITFTNREIDIISCILNARGSKKIASILVISPRTVETHIQNILTKIGTNSQDGIIDFVEKSGEFKVIKEHYLNLLLTTMFEQQLKQLSHLATKHKPSCVIVSNQEDFKDKDFQRLIQHLKIAGFEVLTSQNEAAHDLKKSNDYHNIYLLSQKNIEQLLTAGSFELQKKDIFLVKDNVTQILVSKNHRDIATQGNLIDFFTKDQYFQNVFQILKELLPNTDLSRFISEFKRLSHSIINSKLDDIPDLLLDGIQNPKIPLSQESIVIHHQADTGLFPEWVNKNVILKLLSCIVAVVLISMLLLQLKITHSSQSHNTLLATQENINKTLPKFFKDLSVRNLTIQESTKNYEVIKQFDGIIKLITSEQIHLYFNSKILQSGELINCLYNLNAISSYFLFREHDAEKAIKVLSYAKSLAEAYVTSRSKLPINFAKLTPTEIYTELAVIEDLPEMYTIILYFLGRGYIYQKNINYAEQYLQLSEFLGSKLRLFEGLLSTINGLAIIKMDKADLDIQKHNYIEAQKTIKDCIKIYESSSWDGKSYKKNYRPYNYNPSAIVPKQDIYHIIDCIKRITKLYTKLAKITNNKLELTNYMEAVYNQYIDTQKSPGIINIIIQSQDILSRIAADLYNALGYFLLECYDKDINLNKFQSLFTSKLKLVDGSGLELIYQIFDLAKSISRNTEFTKADSYDGLAKVTERMFNHASTKEQQQELLQKIQELKKSRDLINQTLKRG